MIKITQKCGSYWDFNNIRWIYIGEKYTEIYGNFKHGGRYEKITTNTETITNIIHIKTTLEIDEGYTVQEIDKVCPNCSSRHIIERKEVLQKTRINEKHKPRDYTTQQHLRYKCSKCNLLFKEPKQVEEFLLYE